MNPAFACPIESHLLRDKKRILFSAILGGWGGQRLPGALVSAATADLHG
ncbi:hypothetical protein [Lysobacter gummosus]